VNPLFNIGRASTFSTCRQLRTEVGFSSALWRFAGRPPPSCSRFLFCGDLCVFCFTTRQRSMAVYGQSAAQQVAANAASAESQDTASASTLPGSSNNQAWEKCQTPDGRIFFQHVSSRETTWIDPYKKPWRTAFSQVCSNCFRPRALLTSPLLLFLHFLPCSLVAFRRHSDCLTFFFLLGHLSGSWPPILPQSVHARGHLEAA
jgi:hypothetical protein